jgi:hypothetical protein
MLIADICKSRERRRVLRIESAISGSDAMKSSGTLSALAALVAFSSLASLSPARAIECNVKANRTIFGQSMNAGFSIKSGRSCTSGYTSGGMVQDAKVKQQPQHGTVRLPNNSSFEYRAQPGYTGSDAFVIEATGSGTRGTGTSVVPYNVTVR